MVKFNVYYEISDFVAENATFLGMKGKYFVLLNQTSIDKIPFIHYELARNSERVWQERDGHEIKCIKNKLHGLDHPSLIEVDEKEFMWIKLASKAIN